MHAVSLAFALCDSAPWLPGRACKSTSFFIFSALLQCGLRQIDSGRHGRHLAAGGPRLGLALPGRRVLLPALSFPRGSAPQSDGQAVAIDGG